MRENLVRNMQYKADNDIIELMRQELIIWGKVQRGKNRGKKLGYPTANIRLHKNIPEGIYASTTKIKNVEHGSVTFIGAAKTFGEKDKKVETFILDFNKNLYGKWISVRLVKKIRSNKKFSSVRKLQKQMEEDIKEAKLFFKSRNFVDNK